MIKKLSFSAIFSTLLPYLLCSFYSVSFDFSEWTDETRFVYVFAVLVLFFGMAYFFWLNSLFEKE